MADPVNMHDAKTQLSKLVERAEAGHETVIARAGKPVAKLVPLLTKSRVRKLAAETPASTPWSRHSSSPPAG